MTDRASAEGLPDKYSLAGALDDVERAERNRALPRGTADFLRTALRDTGSRPDSGIDVERLRGLPETPDD